MKKTFLIALTAVIFVFIFAFSASAVNASAENPLGKYDSDPGVDSVTHRVTAEVSFDLSDYFVRTGSKNNVILGDTTAKSVLYDSVTDGYYVFESIYLTQDMTKFEYYVSDLNTAIVAYAQANGIEGYPQFSMLGSWGSRGINEVVHYQMPQGITTLDGSHCMLRNNNLMKTVWVASTIKSASSHIFSYNRSLEYIYNFENVQLSDGFNFNNIFENSPRLKEVKLPDITASIGNLGQMWGSLDGVTDLSVAQSRTLRIYIPNGNYTINSNFYQVNGNAGSFEFVYCGDDYEAFLAKNTVLADVTVVSAGSYTLGSFTNKYNFICDYSYCEAYLNGVHEMSQETYLSIDSYTEAFDELCDCTKCSVSVKVNETAYEPIISFFGYAASMKTNQICTGYSVSRDSIEAYERVTGKKISFGVVAVVPPQGTDMTTFEPVNADLTPYNENTILTSIEGTAGSFEFIIKGFNEDYYDLALTMCAYVSNGKEVDYIESQDGVTVQSAYAGTITFAQYTKA